MADLNVSSLFPAITPFSGGAAGFLGGVQAGTAVNAAQQQLDAAGMANQSAALDLQNKVADQPNIAAARTLTGLQTAGGIANAPTATAANLSALQANIAKASLSASDDDLKEQGTRFSAVDALDKYINKVDSDGNKTFDPGNMEHQRAANELAKIGHPDHQFKLFGPSDQAQIAAAAPMARAANDSIQNTLEQRQKLAQITTDNKGKAEIQQGANQTAIGVANIDADAKKTVALFGMYAQQGASGLQMAQALMAMPEDKQTALFAYYEKNKDGAISPETHDKLVAITKAKLDSSKDPDYETAKKAVAERALAWNAMDTTDVRQAVLKEGLLTQADLQGMKSKQEIVAAASAAAMKVKTQAVAEQKVKEMGYGKVDPKVEPYDIPKSISQMGLGRAADRLAAGGNNPPTTNSSQLPTTAPAVPDGATPFTGPQPSGLPPGKKIVATIGSGKNRQAVLGDIEAPSTGTTSPPASSAAPATAPTGPGSAAALNQAELARHTRPDFSKSETAGDLLRKLMNDKSNPGRQGGQ
jgi:hypothetical protein